MRKYFIILCMILLLLVSCTPGSQSDEIKVGVIAPITGPLAVLGEWMTNGIDIAVEEINSQGGVNGKKIKLIYEDTKCIDNAATVTAMNKLRNVDRVVAMIGPYCGTTNKLAGQFSTENEMFFISPGDNFGNNGKYKVNTRYLLDEEARLMANHALNEGNKKIAVLYFNNDWGLQYRDVIKKEFENVGGELTGSESYTYDNLDVSTSLLKLMEGDPDALVIIDSTTGDLFRQAKELGINVTLLSEWEIESGIDKFGEALEGVVYALPVTERTKFHDRFNEEHGRDPNVGEIDSYDATFILAKALEACSDYDPQCMTDYASNLENYPGAGGPMSFNKEKWAFEKPFVHKTIKDGKAVILE